VQRHFTKRLSGLRKVQYDSRLQILGLQSLERPRLNYDLTLVYKILHGLTDTTLSDSFVLLNGITRGHCFKLLKSSCSKDISSVIGSVMHGISCHIIWFNPLVYKLL